MLTSLTSTLCECEMSVRRHLRTSGASNWHYTLDRVQGQRKNAEHAEAQRAAEKRKDRILLAGQVNSKDSLRKNELLNVGSTEKPSFCRSLLCLLCGSLPLSLRALRSILPDSDEFPLNGSDFPLNQRRRLPTSARGGRTSRPGPRRGPASRGCRPRRRRPTPAGRRSPASCRT